MPHYLIQGAYTSEGWAAQVQNPQSRAEALRPVVERLGGTLGDTWLSFGDYDIVAIVEMPDNVSAAAFSIAAAAGGSVKAVRTTPLMSIDEGIEALKMAGTAGYQAPSA